MGLESHHLHLKDWRMVRLALNKGLIDNCEQHPVNRGAKPRKSRAPTR